MSVGISSTSGRLPKLGDTLDIGDVGGYTTNFSDLSGLIIIPGSGDVTTNYVDVNGAATDTPARYYRVRLVP